MAKAQLLTELAQRKIASASLLKRLHELLCFLRAFPDNATVLRLATDSLATFAQRVDSLSSHQRLALADSGIDGTRLCYEFSYHTARLLTHRFPDSMEINWEAYESPERLDSVLIHLIVNAEQQVFDSGEISTEQWVKLAKGNRGISDMAWLMREIRAARPLRDVAESLYDEAAIPLDWSLRGAASIGGNAMAWPRPVYRVAGLRQAVAHPRREIARPLRGIKRLQGREARAMIELALVALAARQREVFSMSCANPEEVYLAPLGAGTHVLVLGVLPQYRLHVEGTYGYVILANGVPVGYGGASPLFGQANTGAHFFAEYRGSEAAYLFGQTLRAFRTLFGTTRFVANPYQFGRDNPEAIRSGAFWFYYKLGFRPVDPGAATLALAEFENLRSRRGARTDASTLRQLAKSDLHLTLAGAKKGDFFDERWLETCARGATAAMADSPGTDRVAQARGIAAEVADALDAGDRQDWPRAQALGFERLAPTVALIDGLARWTGPQKRAFVSLMRAKIEAQERPYVHRLMKHVPLRQALASYCRRQTEGRRGVEL